MILPEPTPGLVISYAYLWWDEARRGREEGTKDRPCVVVLAVRQSTTGCTVTVAPVTHSPPRAAREAVELPAATKLRLGLDERRSWIVTTEVNRFQWPGPDLRPIAQGQPGRLAYGFIPRKLWRTVVERMAEHHRQRELRAVRRDEQETRGR
jgi:mRNA-degrading endonuclease toxin of MazEF toxin-antitoxin module